MDKSQAQSTKKRQQFSISIRRKQVNQRLQAMRSQILSEVQTNFQKFYPIINQINNQQKSINQCLKQLKILSYSAEPATIVFKAGIHHKLYSYLSEKTEQMIPSQYSDILTILINLCVHVDLDLNGKVMQVVASSILKPQRQMASLWLLANIIYQKSQFSGAIAKQLVQKCDAVEYMESRYEKKFLNQGDIVIFNFFCCGFLVVSSFLSPSHVKRIYKVIQQILKYQHKSEQNYWFLSQALVDHGAYIGMAEYEIFGTEIINKFGYYCKNKKTKYVKNYLKMLIAFTTFDKLAYEKFLKYELFKHLDFCLQNRFPQIKKLCAEIGFILLQYFGDKVDIQNIGFFQQLVLEILNLQKHTQDAQISITKYCVKFFTISGMNKVTKQGREKLINDILSTNIISITSSCIVNSNGNIQLLNYIIYLLSIFIKLDQSENKKVINRCRNQKMVSYLEHLILGNNNFSINNQGLFNVIEKFLQILQ